MNRSILTTLISVFIFLLYSCDKEPSKLGMSIYPGSDQAELAEVVVNVETFTQKDDRIASSQRSFSPLGKYFDPVFGMSRAMFTCQVLLSKSNVDFTDFVENANSVKLFLKHTGSLYGELDDAANIRVYRINEKIFRDSVYYSDFRISENNLELLAETKLEIGEDSIITVDLSDKLIDVFMDPQNQEHFVDNEKFIDFFKGIYVETVNTGQPGYILYLSLLHNQSGIVFNYNDDEEFIFEINVNSAIINQFDKDYSISDPYLQSVLSNDSENNTYCYVQSLAGLKTRINFEGLLSYFEDYDEIIAINKAQLKIYIKQDTDIETFTPPPTLSLIAITEQGGSEFLTDYKVNQANFGGALNSTLYEYTFNIPFHVQELINGRKDLGLHLIPLNNRIYADRAVFYGGGHNENPMKIEILYSKY